jgi:hypothetical protein
MYYKKDTYRCDITLSKLISVRKEKMHHFEVITPNKVYHFRCKQGDSATEWVKMIKAAIRDKIDQDKLRKTD